MELIRKYKNLELYQTSQNKYVIGNTSTKELSNEFGIRKIKDWLDLDDNHFLFDASNVLWEQYGWTITDPNYSQCYKKITPTDFEFKEYRIFDPITYEVKLFEAEIDLTEYSIEEMIDACEVFGYSSEEVQEWWNNQDNDLIAECLFELMSD